MSNFFWNRLYHTNYLESIYVFLIRSNSSVTESSKSSFSPSQVAYLFTFLAQQIAKDDQCLTVPKEKFEHVLNVLTDNNEISHREERQQALFDMLNARGLDYWTFIKIRSPNILENIELLQIDQKYFQNIWTWNFIDKYF